MIDDDFVRNAWRTEERCPECTGFVVYNGNYFCEHYGAGCMWAMSEDENEQFVRNCYSSLILNRVLSGEERLYIISPSEDAANAWATHVGIPPLHYIALLRSDHLRLVDGGWVILSGISSEFRGAVRTQLIPEREVCVPRSWWR